MAKAKSGVRKTAEALRAFALGLPGAVEDFPWGERVMKVNKKVFVFMGKADGEWEGLGVKLPHSGALALELPSVEPAGYGLGKSGARREEGSAIRTQPRREAPPAPLTQGARSSTLGTSATWGRFSHALGGHA
jgi:hypothetical protein